MNDFSNLWIRVAATLYLVGLADSILTLLRRETRMFQFALAAVQAAVVFHFVSIAEHTKTLGRLPVGNFFDTASMCSFMFAVVFLLVYWRETS